MRVRSTRRGLGLCAGVAVLVFSGAVAAQDTPSACVEQGALAFDNWTKSDAGGSGVPAGVTSSDYLRCKSCHGWDRMGIDGGYVRRSRTSSRPNAGAGDGDATSRAIVTGAFDTAGVVHAGTGRSYADGEGSWVALSDPSTAANTAAHANGVTLGNQHPDFSDGGVNGAAIRPTVEQVNCLVEFLNYMDGDASAYFADIDAAQNPVLYTMIPGADAVAGEVFYADACEGCHGVPETFVLGYLEGDGKFSELAHKARWGSPDTEMTRDALGNPTAQNIADMLLYLQGLGGTGFAMNAGLNGNWKEAENASLGQGFQLEVSTQGEGLVLVATFYTYNNVGEQVWLLGVGPVNGNTADVTVYIYGGPSWGPGYDPADWVETEWGTGVFTAASCGSVSMTLQPNATAQGMGFTNIAQDLVRGTTPAMPCPMVAQN
jgi:hypothetical protein